jgi:hypothetical protein
MVSAAGPLDSPGRPAGTDSRFQNSRFNKDPNFPNFWNLESGICPSVWKRFEKDPNFPTFWNLECGICPSVWKRCEKDPNFPTFWNLECGICPSVWKGFEKDPNFPIFWNLESGICPSVWKGFEKDPNFPNFWNLECGICNPRLELAHESDSEIALASAGLGARQVRVVLIGWRMGVLFDQTPWKCVI